MPYKTRIRTSSPRRKLIWARQPAVDFSTAAAGTINIDLLANFEAAYGAQLIGCTVMRMRGRITMTNTVQGVAFNALLPTVVGVQVSQPVAALSSVIGPITAPYADWMMYDALYFNNGSDPAAGSGGLPSYSSLEFDVKSMRKIEELQQLLVMSFQAHPGAPTRSYNLSISTLLALP